MKLFSRLFGSLILLAMLFVSPVYAAGAMDDFAPGEIVAELKPELDLNDKQVKDMTAALGELGKTLHALIEKEEANKEEDPNEFIQGVKKAQTDYQGKVKGILTDKQLEDYNAIREAAIMDMMKDLEATGALTGFLGAAYFYPYAAMQLPAGLLSDSWGPRNTITLFFIIALIGSVILGLAPTVFIAILGRTMVGLGVAMLFVPTMKILAEWFKADEFAFMTGILMAIGGLGSIAGALVAGLMLGVTETLGAFYISSAYKDAIGFLMMAFFLLFRPQGLFGQK